MIELETLDDVPEAKRADYVKVSKDGKDIYQHKEFQKVLTAMTRKGEERDQFKTQAEANAARLKELEGKETERQTAAEQKAYEKLKSEGKIDEILADKDRRHGESLKQMEDRLKARDAVTIKKAREAVVGELSSLATDKGQKAFAKLIADRVDYDPETDKYTFKDEDGGATSLDMAGFKADVLKSETYASMLKADASSGGHGKSTQKPGSGAPNNAGNIGGNKAERAAAISKMFPDLE